MLRKLSKSAQSIISLRRFGIALGLLSAVFIGTVTAGGTHVTKSFDDLDWVEAAPGLHFGLLWGDWANGEEYAMIVKIDAGVELPRHSHTADYHGTTIQGNWVHTYGKNDERTLPPGSTAFQPGKEVHGDRCEGTEDCLILLHQHGARDLFLE